MIALVAALALSGCATGVGYLWKQSGYFLRFSSGTRDIDSVLKDSRTSPDVRALLQEVKDIKSYAVKKIGLSDNANYTRYKELDRDYLVTVVQACDAVSFTPYQWSYPFLGRLPYKGFYDPDDAKNEAEGLKKKGFDVIVRKVDAFSTLGFFSDPVYSFMKNYSPYDLSSIIIHEQTHATIFLKGQTQFNEELASFIGDTGALEFLRATYGEDSSQYRDAISEQADSALFLAYLTELKQSLQEVYQSPLSTEEKIARKAEIIAASRQRYVAEYVPRFKSEAYRGASDLPLNNAFLSLYDLYTEDVPLLRQYYEKECGSELPVFVGKMKVLSKESKDVAAAIRGKLALLN